MKNTAQINADESRNFSTSVKIGDVISKLDLDLESEASERPPSSIKFNKNTYRFTNKNLIFYVYDSFMKNLTLKNALVFAFIHNSLKSKPEMVGLTFCAKYLANNLGLSYRDVLNSLRQLCERGAIEKHQHDKAVYYSINQNFMNTYVGKQPRHKGVWMEAIVIKHFGVVAARFLSELHYIHLAKRKDMTGKDWASLLGISLRCFWDMVKSLKIPYVISVQNNIEFNGRNHYELSISDLQAHINGCQNVHDLDVKKRLSYREADNLHINYINHFYEKIPLARRTARNFSKVAERTVSAFGKPYDPVAYKASIDSLRAMNASATFIQPHTEEKSNILIGSAVNEKNEASELELMDSEVLEIQASDESDFCKQTRMLILDKVGSKIYRSCFKNETFIENNEEIHFCKPGFFLGEVWKQHDIWKSQEPWVLNISKDSSYISNIVSESDLEEIANDNDLVRTSTPFSKSDDRNLRVSQSSIQDSTQEVSVSYQKNNAHFSDSSFNLKEFIFVQDGIDQTQDLSIAKLPPVPPMPKFDYETTIDQPRIVGGMELPRIQSQRPWLLERLGEQQ